MKFKNILRLIFGMHQVTDDGLFKYRDGLKVFKKRNQWGNDFSSTNLENGNIKIIGHSWVRPEPGDLFVFKMKGGRDAFYKVIESHHFLDPRDMYTAIVKPLHYCDEVDQSNLTAGN